LNKIKLAIFRFFTKVLLKFGKRFFLSSRFVQVSRKIADLALKNSLEEGEICEIQGFKIKRGKSMRYLILAEEYEPAETNLIKKYVKPGMTVFDLGANIGWFTMILSKIVGDTGHVYSFEPDPDYFLTLKENIKLNHLENVSIFEMGVSNYSGITNFSLNEEFGTLVIDDKQKENSVKISTTTMDEFCLKNHIKIDFMKMDVEGSEPLVFEGMEECLRHNPDLKIIMEFHPDAMRGVGQSPQKYLEKIKKSGFKINQIHESGEIEEIEEQDLLKLKGSASFVNLFCFRK
jgi:FkbM family methyltransferase